MARGRKASSKQAEALALISKGVEPTTAMLKAGYSKATARNPKNNLLMRPSAQSVVEVMNSILNAEGITPSYLAYRLAKLAQRDDSKDFLSAYDRIAKLNGIEPDKSKQGTTTVEQSFTEWVTKDGTKTEKKQIITEVPDNALGDLNKLDDIPIDTSPLSHNYDVPVAQDKPIEPVTEPTVRVID